MNKGARSQLTPTGRKLYDLDYAKRWREAHPGYHRDYTRRWRERNPDYHRVYYKQHPPEKTVKIVWKRDKERDSLSMHSIQWNMSPDKLARDINAILAGEKILAKVANPPRQVP